MEELERLKRKIKNARELQSLVKIMKTISASNIREYEQAVESLNEYSKTIEMGLQILMRNEAERVLTFAPSESRGRLGAVVFGSDQGMCGNFNELVASFAVDKMKGLSHQEPRVLAVGERVIAHLEEAGQPVEAHFSFSGNHLGLTQVMLDLLLKIEEWRTREEADRIILFYNRPGSDAAFSSHMAVLFPLELRWLASLAEKKWPSRVLPAFSIDAFLLFSSLVRQYLFFSLFRALVESLASENASRLLSMQMAEKNIEEHLIDLNVQFQKQRQAAITSELLDVVVGFEALTGR